MSSNKQTSLDYEKPVAYDANGQPLYLHPPIKKNSSKESRSSTGKKSTISDTIKLKHDRSVELYPDINLSEGEYVISAVKRHPIGMFIPLSIGVFLISLAFIVLFNFDLIIQAFRLNIGITGFSLIAISMVLFIILIVIGTYIFYYVYSNNRFYLTNESVIQEIQTGIFSKLEQTVSLSNIEDASFTQIGIAQQMFNYGSIRLSTEGEETTYRFSYVANPKSHIAIINNAIEDFQNCRSSDN
ncbi:MAG: hypothetical protein PWQ10_1 [Patescibacteria group bacterium]|nr:hypothetical protein [Patescibacteria group bacterium]